MSNIRTTVRSSLIALAAAALVAQAAAAPQRSERAQRTEPTQVREPSRPAPSNPQSTGRDSTVRRKPAELAKKKKKHIPDKRVYSMRMREEVGSHRSRMARLDRLHEIYTAKRSREKLTQVASMRSREMARFSRLMRRFRDALGEADFQKIAAQLRVRERQAARVRPSNGPDRGSQPQPPRDSGIKGSDTRGAKVTKQASNARKR